MPSQVIMKAVAALALVFAVGAYAACDPDPDHTNEGIFYHPCKDGMPLQVNSFAVTNDDGSNNYPVNVSAPVDVMLNVTNLSSKALDRVFCKGSIERYTDLFGTCTWLSIPTFGLTDHLDVCNFGTHPICPLPPGVNILKDRLDLSQFEPIIQILSVTMPYRLTLVFSIDDVEIACATLEAKIKK